MRRLMNRFRVAVARAVVSRAIILAVLSGPIVGVSLVLGALSAQDAKSSVTIDNFTFSPGDLTVPVGTTVTWLNHDDIPHSVVEKDKAFRSKALDTDDSYSFTFATAGTFEYFCGLHPHMTGKVIVKP